jgi:phosphopantothenoylcysteine decarboxylase/phosphopantothenate--cysteine ligase
MKAWPSHDVLIMSAAVADYTPVRESARKLKKQAKTLTLALKPTRDVLRSLAHARRGHQTVIGFALEDRNARRNAQRKLQDKKLDAILLNAPRTIGAANASFEVLESKGEWVTWPKASKSRIGERIVRLAERISRDKQRTR